MTHASHQFPQSSVGRQIVRRLGLPNPTPLRRYRPGEPPLNGPALVGAAKGGRLADGLKLSEVDLLTEPVDRHGALVFDATGITEPARLREPYDFFHPVLRSLNSCGRVIVLGSPPELTTGGAEVPRRALAGITR